MNWMFWRKPAPPAPPPSVVDHRVWNEDWKAGDTAEVVTPFDKWHKELPPWRRLPLGQRYIVTGFSDGFAKHGGSRQYFLHLDGVEGQYSVTAFRKVRPIATEQSEVVERILSNKEPGKDRLRTDAVHAP